MIVLVEVRLYVQMSDPRVKISQGLLIWYDGIPCTVDHLHGDSLHVIRQTPQGGTECISFSEAYSSGRVSFEPPFSRLTNSPIDLIAENEQEEALRRLSFIRSLVDDDIPFGTKTFLIEDAAKTAGVSTKTISNWLKLYDQGGVSGLAPNWSDRGAPGKGRLEQVVEEIIQDQIKQYILLPNPPTISRLVMNIHAECDSKGITNVPSRPTIQNRVDQCRGIDVMAAQYGADSARADSQVSRESNDVAKYPLDIVQIDHTPMNVIAVDREFRQPMVRPWVTLAIDVNDKLPLGYYITLKKPSYISVIMCLYNCVFPKKELLERYELCDSDWPAYGLPKIIHTDNAKEFHTGALGVAAHQYFSEIMRRPKGFPSYGGHVERILGTMKERIQEVPGTTFSSIKERGRYSSEKYACLTLDEIGEYFLLALIEYNKTRHKELRKSPIQEWNLSLEKGDFVPSFPKDKQRFYLDLLPSEKRQIGKSGISMFGLSYSSSELQKIKRVESAKHAKSRGKRKVFGQKYTIKYDRRDISKIYFLNPVNDEYILLPTINRYIGRISLDEWYERLKILKIQYPDMALSERRKLAVRMENIVQKAAADTKAAKRARAKAESEQRGFEETKEMAPEVPSSTQVPAKVRETPTFDPSKIKLKTVIKLNE